MKQDSKNIALTLLIPAILALFIAKALWVFAELKFLPKRGVDVETKSSIKPLYYHYSLASKKLEPKVVTKAQSKPKPKPKPKPQEIKKFILTGIYNSKEKKLIALKYLNKNYVLQLGEELAKYKFIKLFPTYAIFSKDGQEFKLQLYKNGQKNSKAIAPAPSQTVAKPDKKATKNQIKREGDTTYIPKSLFNKYKNNFREIQKNIGVIPNMTNGKLDGFKITFVRKGSDFDKLGVKRGDIIKAVNGEPLDNMKVPMQLFSNLDSLTAATIIIQRGNETKELNYEIRSDN